MAAVKRTEGTAATETAPVRAEAVPEAVSVHIVTYNSENDIAGCLEAVLQQTHPIRQIIVVDNRSADRTRDVLQGFAERHPGRLTLMFNDRNTGFAPGHNQAIRASDSDFFLVLNPDVELHPDYVARLLACFRADPRVGSATGKLLSKADPDRVDSTGLTMTKARRAFDRGAGEPAANWDEAASVFGVSGAAAMYARRMAEHISLDGEFFDEAFFAYKEDVDVAWRARLYGWEARYVPDAVAWHERGWKAGQRKKQPLKIRRHSYINRYRMMLKNDGFRQMLPHLPALLKYELLSAGYVLLREPQLLPAWPALFKDWRKLMRQRKAIRANRRVSYGEIRRFFE